MTPDPEPSAKEPRSLLYCWSSATLDVLVPKLRGSGFLKVPLGHHHDPAMCELETLLKCDICGLDGHLSIYCGMKVAVYREKRAPYVEKAMPLIAKRFRCSKWREIGSAEFFAHLGLKPTERDADAAN